MKKWIVDFFKNFFIASLALALACELLNLSFKPIKKSGLDFLKSGSDFLILFDNIYFGYFLLAAFTFYILLLARSKKLSESKFWGLGAAVTLIACFNQDFFQSIRILSGKDYQIDIKFPVLFVLIWLIPSVYEALSRREEFKKKSKEEKPENSAVTDKFGRRAFARKFLEPILEDHSINHLDEFNRVFGLQAPWGTGKTTTLGYIKEILLDKEREKIILIEFNPWYCNDETQVAAEFLALLMTKLEERFPLKAFSLEREITVYKKLLSNQYQSWLDILSPRDEARKNEFEKINKLLEDLTKEEKIKILVFIDDLDRLEAALCLKTLQLIRQLAAFRNIKFIVTYDKAHLMMMISKEAFNTKYLDKIFPNETLLPQIPKDHLADCFFEKLEPFLTEDDREILKIRRTSFSVKREPSVGEEGLQSIDSLFHTELNSFRDLEKLLNDFKNTYQFIKDDVFLWNLLILELLKLNHSQIYSKLTELIEITKYRGEKRIYVLKHDYENNLSDNQEERRRQKALLEYLFAKNKQHVQDLNLSQYQELLHSISQLDYHDLYFSHGFVPDSSKLRPSEFKRILMHGEDLSKAQEVKVLLDDKSKLKSLFNLVEAKEIAPINKYYLGIIEMFFLLSTKVNEFNDIKAIAKSLISRLLEDGLSEYENKFLSLKHRLSKDYRSLNPLFIIHFIKHCNGLYVKPHGLGLRQGKLKSIFQDQGMRLNEVPADQDIDTLLNNVLEDYLKNKLDQYDHKYLDHFVAAWLETFPDKSSLFKKLAADKETFKRFLEVSIGARDKPNKLPDYLGEIFRENGGETLPLFLKPWQGEAFAKEYKKFVEEFLKSGKDSIDFNFKELQIRILESRE
jgi:hypothetical protein